jgi:hypothetical protein
MKKNLLTIVATIAVFTAGVFAGMWIQRNQPVPAPPIGIMGELRDVPLTGTPHAPNAEAHKPQDLVALKSEMDHLKPEIEEFKRKVEPIKTEFREKLEAVLTPEQREKLKELSERFNNPPPQQPGKPEGPRRRGDGLDSLFPIVIVPATLDRLTDKLALSPEQRTAVHALLLNRRQKFLELVDTSPPPSLKLQRLAPLVPQIASPPQK